MALVEREPQLEALDGALAANASAGSVVLVAGEAGIGKTAPVPPRRPGPEPVAAPRGEGYARHRGSGEVRGVRHFEGEVAILLRIDFRIARACARERDRARPASARARPARRAAARRPTPAADPRGVRPNRINQWRPNRSNPPLPVVVLCVA
jgi:hypothetical protein